MQPMPPSTPARLEVPHSDDAAMPKFDVPPMRIVVLLSGTVGDVMPFVQMAKMLHERYGHVVRIASHDDLRAPVEKAGIRFYPIKGNARQMAGWGPSFSLHLPTFLKLMTNPMSAKKIYIIRNSTAKGTRTVTSSATVPPKGREP